MRSLVAYTVAYIVTFTGKKTVPKHASSTTKLLSLHE